MQISDIMALQSGHKYRVKIKGKPTSTRIFIDTEKRLGDILCAVFSTALRRGAYGDGGVWSVPHYAIEKCDRVTK